MRRELKECDVCKNFIPEIEAKNVSIKMNLMDIEEFVKVIEAMGLSDRWETAVICNLCFEYYRPF